MKKIVDEAVQGGNPVFEWVYLNSDELKFKKDIPSIGSIKKDPLKVFEDWMPDAHATKTDTHQEPQEETEFQKVTEWTPAPRRE